MIVGIGTDIIAIGRMGDALARHPGTFARRAFTAAERATGAARGPQAIAYYAGRWAAKEAVAKALGCGIGTECGWQDIEIVNGDGGQPRVQLRGCGAATAVARGVDRIHLSISHGRDHAVAFVVLESE